jgi:hypothetical protein
MYNFYQNMDEDKWVKYAGFCVVFSGIDKPYNVWKMESQWDIVHELTTSLENKGFVVGSIDIEWECEFSGKSCCNITGITTFQDNNEISLELFSYTSIFKFHQVI